MVREILTQKYITWLQVILGNTLLYQVSVSDCPGLACGIFCILIVDLVSRRALVVFSLLRAHNITTTRGLYVMYFFSTVNIATVSYQYCSYLYYHNIHLCRYICCYCPLTYNDYVILNMLYFKLSLNFHFLTCIESVTLWYFQTQCFCSLKRNPQPSIFDHQQQVQKPSAC